MGTGSGDVAAPRLPSKEDWFNPTFRFPESGFSLEQAILRLIEHALAETRGMFPRAAHKLGVSRDYLRYRLGGWKDSGNPESHRRPANWVQIPNRRETENLRHIP